VTVAKKEGEESRYAYRAKRPPGGIGGIDLVYRHVYVRYVYVRSKDGLCKVYGIYRAGLPYSLMIWMDITLSPIL
jgi:hypothetical protein